MNHLWDGIQGSTDVEDTLRVSWDTFRDHDTSAAFFTDFIHMRPAFADDDGGILSDYEATHVDITCWLDRCGGWRWGLSRRSGWIVVILEIFTFLCLGLGDLILFCRSGWVGVIDNWWRGAVGHDYTRKRGRKGARTIGGCAGVGTLGVLVELSVGWRARTFSGLFAVWHCPSISVIFVIFYGFAGWPGEYVWVILGDMDLESNVRGMRGRRKGRTIICTDIPLKRWLPKDKSQLQILIHNFVYKFNPSGLKYL